MAGTISYLAPVDNASGKIFGKKQRFMAVTRKTGKRIRGCAATSPRNLVEHPYSEAEQARKTKFTAVAAAVRECLGDPTKKTQDQIAFKEQSHYKTLRQYVWHLEWEAYQPA